MEPIDSGVDSVNLNRFVRAGIERLRAKLLDLSMANRLLNFKHSEKSRTHIRVVNEIPETLFGKLEDAKNLQFAWIDEPDVEPADERTPEFREALTRAKEEDPTYIDQRQKLRHGGTKRQIAKLDRALRDRVRLSLGLPPRTTRTVADRARELGVDPTYDLPERSAQPQWSPSGLQVQTLFYRDDMDSKLAAIREGDRTLIQDAGINALYAAFGFVEWYESSDSEAPAFAPLLFYPVEVQRTLEDGMYKYALVARDDDVETNQAFAELLKANAALELPAWHAEGTISEYFRDVQKLLESQRRWRLRRWVTVGLFTFAKLAMYRDLDSRRWVKQGPLESHPILSDLLVGTGTVSDVILAADYEIDSPKLATKDHALVTDADSSQHSAVIDVLEGKNLVIQGPPGTGKSQTITNIIATAMNNGKRVLFVAEKMAALQVVKSRLDHFGLGQFCLEVHSNKTRKTAVLKSLEERLNFLGPQLDTLQLRHALQAHEQAHNELIYYVTRMKEPVGETGLSVYEILRGNCIRTSLADRLPAAVLRVRLEQPYDLDPFTREELVELARDLGSRCAAINKWKGIKNHPWRGVENTGLDIFRSEELILALRSWNESLAVLESTIATATAETGWPIDQSLRGARDFSNIVAAFPEVPENFCEDIPRSLKTQSDYSVLTAAIGDIEKLIELRSEIGQIADDIDLLVDVGSSHVATLAESAHSLGLLGARAGVVEKLHDERERIADALGKTENAASQFSSLFGISDPRITDLTIMIAAVSVSNEIPRRCLSLRDPVAMAEEHLHVLQRGARQSDSLHKLKAQLDETFQFSLTPALSEISKAAKLLLSANWFQKLFSRNYHLARRLYKAICKPGPSPKQRAPDQELTSLATYLKQSQELEADAELRRAAGRFAAGINTPWRELVAVSEWSTKVRQTFSSDANSAYCDLLLSADFKKIDAILSFARGQEFSLVIQLVAKPPQNSDSSVKELADIARARAFGTSEFVRDLKKLRISPNTSLGDLGILATKLNQLEEVKQRLGAAAVQEILGSNGSLWVDRIRHLHATVDFVTALVGANPPQVFWTKLTDEPLLSLIEALKTQAAALCEAFNDVHGCQDQVSRLARLDFQIWIDRRDLDSSSIQKVRKRIDYALDNTDALQSYLDFLRVELRTQVSPLAPVLGPLREATGDYGLLPEACEFIFYRSCAEKLLAGDSKLSSHSGATHEQLRNRYQQLDRKIIELHRQQIASNLTERRIEPGVGFGRASDFTELALIRRQMGIQRRHLPLRELFWRAGNAIQSLKPCFMMSPMSVAQFLEPNGIRFDLVVMDEASQIRPEDALGAMARGTQVVVVGDPMQLPPTSFFEKVDRDDSGDEDPEEAEVQDLTGQESILDWARGPFQPVRQLRWHYRSRHESLIAFSNHEFYGNSLIVFPSPQGDNPQFGVRIVEVEGVYESSQNRREAEAVVTAAQTFMHDFPNQSLGIVAMNRDQQDLLQKLMDDLFASDVEAEAYRLQWENTLESTFVKNLENVQGDERDVIFISTVYGKDAAGNFYQRLGPINGVHGHRRLNVLFTRAKQQVRLFTSMKSSDLRIEEKTRWGVKALKNYLSFAKDGHFEVGDVTSREPDSVFERWVIQMLRETGYEVVPQLGVAGYFIDLAIRHPDRNGAFILGVECDGAMYHSARSVRDRDRLRQEILVRLNWNIYRIWSTDWFRNPRLEFKKLVDRIEDLRREKIRIRSKSMSG